MFQIQFTNNPNNLFHKSLHVHYKGALQIVTESNEPAHIIDYDTGELLYEHNPAPLPPFESWTDVYKIFMEIADRVLSSTPNHDEANELICGEIDQLYAQHEGDPLWDSAYERWYEPSDDDTYVVDESSPILK